MKTNLVALKRRIKELTDAIAPLATERAELEQKVLESQSPFVVGDIIAWNKGARRGRVVKIVPWCCGHPMWKVARILKDGSEGEIVEVRDYMGPQRVNDPAHRPARERNT